MYLLQSTFSQSFLFYLLAIIMTLVLFYFLVKTAVMAAQKETREEINFIKEAMTIQNRLLAEDLLRKGVPMERIEELTNIEEDPFNMNNVSNNSN